MNTNKGLSDFGKELQLANFDSKSNNTNSASKPFSGNFGMESTCVVFATESHNTNSTMKHWGVIVKLGCYFIQDFFEPMLENKTRVFVNIYKTISSTNVTFQFMPLKNLNFFTKRGIGHSFFFFFCPLVILLKYSPICVWR
jgi:hypothetical protein